MQKTYIHDKRAIGRKKTLNAIKKTLWWKISMQPFVQFYWQSGIWRPVTSTLCSSVKSEKQKKPSLLLQAHCAWSSVFCLSIHLYICILQISGRIFSDLRQQPPPLCWCQKTCPSASARCWHGVSDTHCWFPSDSKRFLKAKSLHFLWLWGSSCP